MKGNQARSTRHAGTGAPQLLLTFNLRATKSLHTRGYFMKYGRVMVTGTHFMEQ
jgi:hypothetical protein